MCPVEGLAHDVVASGGEIAVVVIDINQVNVVAVTDPVYQPGQGCYDLGHAVGQRVGVFVLIRVQHVDDEKGSVAHVCRDTPYVNSTRGPRASLPRHKLIVGGATSVRHRSK